MRLKIPFGKLEQPSHKLLILDNPSDKLINFNKAFLHCITFFSLSKKILCIAFLRLFLAFEERLE